MILKFSGLTKKESGGGTIPPIPPIDPEAVNGASFVRIGDTATLKVSDSALSYAVTIKAVLFSCFFRAAPDLASDSPLEFSVDSANKIRIFFNWKATEKDVTRDAKFRVELVNADGSVFGVACCARDIFLRENSWHHIYFHGVVDATSTGFSTLSFRLNSVDLYSFATEFADTDAAFVGQETVARFVFESLSPGKNASWEPSIAHAYCEISNTDSINPYIEAFFNIEDGTPKEITATFGGTPVLYTAVNSAEPLLNYITSRPLVLDNVDWKVVPITPIVTCCYQAFQNTHVGTKQDESYSGYVSTGFFATRPAAADARLYLNIWLADVYVDKGDGMLLGFSDAESYLILWLTAGGELRIYKGDGGGGFYWSTPFVLRGWANVAVYTPASLAGDPILKINDEPAIALTNSAPSGPPIAISGFTLNCSTPTQHVGSAHLFTSLNMNDNPGVDFTDLDSLASSFADPLGQPIWGYMDGSANLGFAPGVFFNPALGLGGASGYGWALNTDFSDSSGGYGGRCTYYYRSGGSRYVRVPFQLFDEITFKV